MRTSDLATIPEGRLDGVSGGLIGMPGGMGMGGPPFGQYGYHWHNYWYRYGSFGAPPVAEQPGPSETSVQVANGAIGGQMARQAIQSEA